MVVMHKDQAAHKQVTLGIILMMENSKDIQLDGEKSVEAVESLKVVVL